MFKLLIFIIALFGLMVLLFGFSVFRMLFGALLGGKKKQRSGRNTQQRAQRNQSQSNKANNAPKIITPDEGEYVDFEEVKD